MTVMFLTSRQSSCADLPSVWWRASCEGQQFLIRRLTVRNNRKCTKKHIDSSELILRLGKGIVFEKKVFRGIFHRPRAWQTEYIRATRWTPELIFQKHIVFSIKIFCERNSSKFWRPQQNMDQTFCAFFFFF